MSAIDRNLPNSFVRNFFEGNPSYRTGVNEETDALFNPSIEAKPLHVPMSMRIKEAKAKDMTFYWAFDRCGMTPNHTRVEQLRAVGFDYATTDDVVMAVEDTVRNRNAQSFSNEIRNGDNRLMKVKKSRWLEIRKSHQLQALMMANPRGKAMGEDGTVMGVQNLIPGVKTTVTEQTEGVLRAAVALSEPTKDLKEVTEGRRPMGNATRISRESVARGVRMTPSAGRSSE
jgi:hypothetical protein